MLNCLWAGTGIHLIFTMETNTILQYMHTHWGSNCHGIQRRGDKMLSAARPIYSAANWTLSQASVYHSLVYSISSLFCSLFTIIFFSQKNYLLSAEDKVLQCSVGAALGRVVTEEKKLCRDPERCPEMQLNRHRKHARTHPPPLSPPVRAAAAAANQKGRGKKYKKKKERGLLYQQQEHYIIGCLCGRVGEEWTEEGRCSL